MSKFGRHTVVLALTTGIVCFVAGVLRADREAPQAVKDAIKKEWPYATILSIGSERENGVQLYEVNIKEGSKRLEVEVTADGFIVEIEGAMDGKDVPKEVADAIARKSNGGEIKRVELHERRGRTRDGKVIKLDHPTKFYEAKVSRDGKRFEVKVSGDDLKGAKAPAEVVLPKAAREAVDKEFPGATLRKVEMENENGLKVYEVKLLHKNQPVEATVTPDGALCEIESVVQTADLPEAVAKQVAEQTKGGKITKIEREETRARVAKGKVTPLTAPETSYEVAFTKNGKKLELEIETTDGKVAKSKVKPADDDDDDDEDDDEDDDD